MDERSKQKQDWNTQIVAVIYNYSHVYDSNMKICAPFYCIPTSQRSAGPILMKAGSGLGPGWADAGPWYWYHWTKIAIILILINCVGEPFNLSLSHWATLFSRVGSQSSLFVESVCSMIEIFHLVFDVRWWPPDRRPWMWTMVTETYSRFFIMKGSKHFNCAARFRTCLAACASTSWCAPGRGRATRGAPSPPSSGTTRWALIGQRWLSCPLIGWYWHVPCYRPSSGECSERTRWNISMNNSIMESHSNIIYLP